MSTAKANLQQNRWAIVGAAVLMILLAYGVGSWAIDSGSIFLYFLVIGLIILACRLLAQAIKAPRAPK